MVYLAGFLFVLAIAALVAEMFSPGTEIFGIFGIIALIVSAVLTVMFVPHGWFIVAGQVVILGLFLRFFIRQIRKRQLTGRIILNETLAEDVTHDLAGFVGKAGVAATMLRPYGEVEFDGVRLEVSSGGPLIEQGERVRAVAIRESKLIVSAVKDGN